MGNDLTPEIISSALHEMTQIARAEARKIHVSEIGIVVEAFPHSEGSDVNNYECDVRLRDSNMVLKRVPVATSHIGLSNIPHTGDLVLLSFLNGDINSPVIIGRLYNNEDRPPVSKEEEVVYIPPYSRKNGIRRLYVELPEGSLKLTLSENGVDIVADADISIKNSGTTVIECGGNIQLKAGGNMELSAGGKLALTASSSMAIKAGGNLSIEGALVKIN